MFGLSAWPIRHIFRLMAVVTVLTCLITAATVTSAYLRQRSQRAAYRTVVSAETAIQTVATEAALSSSNNLIAKFVPGARAGGIALRDGNLATIQRLTGQAHALDIPASDKALIATVAARYRDLGAWLIHVKTPTSAAEGTQQVGEYSALAGAADRSVTLALHALAVRRTQLDAETSPTGRVTNLVTLALCLLTAGLVCGLILAPDGGSTGVSSSSARPSASWRVAT